MIDWYHVLLVATSYALGACCALGGVALCQFMATDTPKPTLRDRACDALGRLDPPQGTQQRQQYGIHLRRWE